MASVVTLKHKLIVTLNQNMYLDIVMIRLVDCVACVLRTLVPAAVYLS